MRSIDELHEKQSLPLELKIRMTEERIRQWVREYGEDGVYISFSGGKDSTVLLDIARRLYPNLKAAFFDTGLEYPEIRQFVKTFDNVDWVKPKMTFKEVLDKYGYPFISKEVSECVHGARQYIARLTEEGLVPPPHVTNRNIPWWYSYEKLTGTGKYAKPIKVAGTGGDFKQSNEKQGRRIESEIGSNVRNDNEGQSDKGEYP